MHASNPSILAKADNPSTYYPQRFSAGPTSPARDVYIADPLIQKVTEFFESKGVGAIKEEDRLEQWYDDWLAFQAKHRIYASLLSPEKYSTLGNRFNLLRLTRLVEAFAYFSPAHAYSLQVTFLGTFSILMGSNEALKREAIAALEAGGLMAFGISEHDHGSDLFANEFTLRDVCDIGGNGDGNGSPAARYIANGGKYYIGNSNVASMIAILARKEDSRRRGSGNSLSRRAPFVLFALRPAQAKGFRNVRKIRTLGVRAAFVGELEVTDQEVAATAIIAEGRLAWDALFGTVTLGKFFLGFASIGICEHAFQEAVDHLSTRILFGEPVLKMPHIRSAMAQAFARLTAMKLYAYRALDYLQTASAVDRRYLLYCAVQKARVSVEGVKVMSLLSECIGAKGFESDTYFEMALRDAQLIPRLEGSTHINLQLAAQFILPYFARAAVPPDEPPSLAQSVSTIPENSYLFEARTGILNTIAFRSFFKACAPLMSIKNVRLFAHKARAFRLFAAGGRAKRALTSDTETAVAMGDCLATIAYAQLIAENAVRMDVPPQVIAAIFHLLVNDLSVSALALASSPRLDAVSKLLLRRLVATAKTRVEDWDFVADKVAACASRSGSANNRFPE